MSADNVFVGNGDTTAPVDDVINALRAGTNHQIQQAAAVMLGTACQEITQLEKKVEQLTRYEHSEINRANRLARRCQDLKEALREIADTEYSGEAEDDRAEMRCVANGVLAELSEQENPVWYGVPISKEDIAQLQAGKVVTKKLFADPDETPVLIKLKPKEK